MVMLLTSCAASGSAINTVVVDTACNWVQPILVSKDDVLTDGTARQLLAHNETWLKTCKN